MLAQRGPSEAVLHFKALDKLGRDGDNLLPGATELGKKRKGGVEEGGGDKRSSAGAGAWSRASAAPVCGLSAATTRAPPCWCQ